MDVYLCLPLCSAAGPTGQPSGNGGWFCAGWWDGGGGAGGTQVHAEGYGARSSGETGGLSQAGKICTWFSSYRDHCVCCLVSYDLCETLFKVDQGLVCSSACNTETMKIGSLLCCYLLQPSEKGPMPEKGISQHPLDCRNITEGSVLCYCLALMGSTYLWCRGFAGCEEILPLSVGINYTLIKDIKNSVETSLWNVWLLERAMFL